MTQAELKADFKDYFSSTAADYAKHRPTYPADMVEYLASVAPSTGFALDCACGTGQLSVLLAEHFTHVLATDASEAQISQAQSTENIEYRVALAQHSGLEDNSVDLITVAQAAHWLDLDAFYDEVQRVAKRDAVLALISYGTTRLIDETLDKQVHYFYHQVIGDYWPAERQHIVDGYKNLQFPFEELGYPPFEMEVEWTLPQLVGYLNTWSAVVEARKQGQGERIEAFFQQLAAHWGKPQQRHKVYWPLTLRVACL